MIPRKLNRLLSAIMVLILTMTTNVYAEPQQRQETIPYGPKLVNLKGKEDLLRILKQLKATRASLINININESTTDQELKEINNQLEIYLIQFDIIKNNLERHESAYKESIPDRLMVERLYLVISSFTISILSQQELIKALRDDRVNAQKLIYSTYLIPVYYFLTLGDQVIAYVETYITMS